MKGTDRRSLLGVIGAAILLAVTVLSGTASAPPQGKPVNITDFQEPDNVADVSADGALEVEGTVTGEVDVGNLPAVQEVTSQDDPGRLAFAKRVDLDYPAATTIDVPANMRLVITQVSGFIVILDGDGEGSHDLRSVRLEGGAAGGGVTHFFVPTFAGTSQSTFPPDDHYTFSDHTQIFVDNEFDIVPLYGRGFSTPPVGGVSISGYLIDCSRSAPACN